MTPAQMETFRQAMNIREGHEWDLFEGLRAKPEEVKAFLDKVPFAQGGERRLEGAAISCAGHARGDDPAGDVDAVRIRRAAQ